MQGNVSGLVELALVVGLLAWFWRSQTAATSKDEPAADAEPAAAPEPPAAGVAAAAPPATTRAAVAPAAVARAVPAAAPEKKKGRGGPKR